MTNYFKMEQALRTILEKLEDIDFALLGTFNLSLQGIEITPHDLDLLTDDEGVDKIGKIFASTITEEKEDHYKETKFYVSGVEVHVVSSENNSLRPRNFQRETIWIQKGDLKIPCMSLKSELQFYQQAGRAKD